MRAAVVEAGRFVVRDVADPTPGPDQLVLQVAATGICGSDLKLAPYLPDGTVMGHELAGTVVAAGADVAETWPVGTRAVSLPVIACGRCRDCAAGDVARCPSADPLGVGAGAGAFAERVLVGARETVPFGDAVPLEDGALVEPLAVGLHAVNRSGVTSEDRLLVVGAGPVGLAVLLWARRMGVREVVASDPSPGRRAAAPHFGATAVVDPGSEPLGGPYDVVVECVGARGMVGACIDAVRPRGRVVVAGVCLEEDPILPAVAVTKDVDVAFVSYYTLAEFALTARLLGSGELDPGPFVTGRVGLDGLDEAVERLRSPQDDRKVLVVP